MAYDALVARLDDGLDPVRFGPFPDGSVDDLRTRVDANRS